MQFIIFFIGVLLTLFLSVSYTHANTSGLFGIFGSTSAPFFVISGIPVAHDPMFISHIGITTAQQAKFDIFKTESLSHPNPFYLHQLEKLVEPPKIHYYLKEAQEITLSIYNSLGHRLIHTQIPGTGSGEQVNTYALPKHKIRYWNPGVYFYLIYNTATQTLLHKGKIAVQP